MRKFIFISTLTLLIAGTAIAYEYAGGKCTGSKGCSACKNCNYCGHCAKQGGSCGVCK